MEGQGKPPPYNYGAIPTDSGYAAPPPYPASGNLPNVDSLKTQKSL